MPGIEPRPPTRQVGALPLSYIREGVPILSDGVGRRSRIQHAEPRACGTNDRPKRKLVRTTTDGTALAEAPEQKVQGFLGGYPAAYAAVPPHRADSTAARMAGLLIGATSGLTGSSPFRECGVPELIHGAGLTQHLASQDVFEKRDLTWSAPAGWDPRSPTRPDSRAGDRAGQFDRILGRLTRRRAQHHRPDRSLQPGVCVEMTSCTPVGPRARRERAAWVAAMGSGPGCRSRLSVSAFGQVAAPIAVCDCHSRGGECVLAGWRHTRQRDLSPGLSSRSGLSSC